MTFKLSISPSKHPCNAPDNKAEARSSTHPAGCPYDDALDNVKTIIAQLVHMPENCGDMHKDPVIRSDGLPKGRSENAGLRMEAGEPLKGRSNGNNEVSMSHRCLGQVLDYSACQPVLA